MSYQGYSGMITSWCTAVTCGVKWLGTTVRYIWTIYYSSNTVSRWPRSKISGKHRASLSGKRIYNTTDEPRIHCSRPQTCWWSTVRKNCDPSNALTAVAGRSLPHNLGSRKLSIRRAISMLEILIVAWDKLFWSRILQILHSLAD